MPLSKISILPEKKKDKVEELINLSKNSADPGILVQLKNTGTILIF
jgi:hypothetical protein